MKERAVEPKEARGLNPEAGRHPVTSDPHEIEGARRAAERSYIEFPYYSFRFGERGSSFGLSDGAWLVTLCDGTEARAVEQVRWLGAVLSSRGMPHLLLERHLEIMHEELRKPMLLRCAIELRRLRDSVIPRWRFEAIAGQFEERVAHVAPFTGMGRLLVSAVADERLGIEHAVTSVESWAADSSRFSGGWLEAVQATIERARAKR